MTKNLEKITCLMSMLHLFHFLKETLSFCVVPDLNP